jgi:hypothetical protein
MGIALNRSKAVERAVVLSLLALVALTYLLYRLAVALEPKR